MSEQPSASRSSGTNSSEPGLSSTEPGLAKIRPPKLYKIGEVMRYSGISRQTLHNYTMLGLITEDERTPSGHRLYGEWVFDRLEAIKRLKQEMSLKQVRAQFEDGNQS